MANISELLEEIYSAVYGEDVREAIHDAIKQCYEDATGNPDSVSAVVQDVTELQSFAANLYRRVTVDATNLSVPANGYATFLYDINAPTGYTPVAIAGFSVLNYTATCFIGRAFVGDDGTISFGVYNTSDTARTDVNVKMKMLCIKNFT